MEDPRPAPLRKPIKKKKKDTKFFRPHYSEDGVQTYTMLQEAEAGRDRMNTRDVLSNICNELRRYLPRDYSAIDNAQRRAETLINKVESRANSIFLKRYDNRLLRRCNTMACNLANSSRNK
jgi:hypothetical protein